ncbi:MAG: hypothetical protein EXQ53_10885 [Acidobacteria bacterium]|nr:hypothetical protein [Acidobacteriota bacterium]
MRGCVALALTGIAVLFTASAGWADPLTCNTSAYRAAPGLTAASANDMLTVTWNGDQGQELRLRLTVVAGVPTIHDIALRAQARGEWKTVAAGLTPDFRVVTGLRRVTEQQLQPLRQLKVDITRSVIEPIKWDAFWDAPLNLDVIEDTRTNAIPPPQGVAGQPGLPRKPEEIARATATYASHGCEVKTNGARLEISFDEVRLGVFAGRLQYTIYKGTNLIEQEVIAKTDRDSVAYKYEAGLKGLAIEPASRVAWRDVANNWQEYRFGGAANANPVPLRANNRLVIAEGPGGSIAAFPPPHNFFWSREVAYNLGYVWYRKDSSSTWSFGVRQPELEAHPEEMGRGEEDTRQNFALRSARPGTWQHMGVYLYVSAAPANEAARGALAFTRDDRFKALPGYQVMATHFHTAMVGRLRRMGGLDARLPDLDVVKAAGVNIFAPIDGSGLGFGSPREDRLKTLADYYEAARRHSDKNFLIMPNEEGAAGGLGGHNDLLTSKPLFWLQGRAAGEPLVENHATYGKVYRIGSPADMMEMARRENLLVFMPHPRSKGSTGYPDAIKTTAHFLDERYRGIGVRWGMGLDGSEERLCELRCQTLWDEMNNWVADLPTPPKFIQAITETYEQGPGDDFYANSPVNYVKLDALPLASSGDWSSIIDAMKRGDYFWTSGEVLISGYAVQGADAKRTIAADVEWTFPLDFVEVVWGDGVRTERQIVSATDLPPFGRKRFEIPFDATGKKWVRFAAWDTAGNGAMVQPIKLTTAPTSTR